MKKNILSCIFTLFAFHIALNLSGQVDGIFSIAVEQNNNNVPVSGGIVKLKREPFKIIITMSEPMGVLISASFKADSYLKAKEGATLSEIPGFMETGMAEGTNNSEKDMMINDNAPSYWFYDDDESNRFDVTYLKDEQIVCERSIKQFFMVDTQTNMKVKDVATDLYLVFLTSSWNNDFTQRTEYQREYMKVQWTE